MIAIDLFSGAGGMSLGAAAAGIEIALAVEADPNAAETYLHNHPETPVHAADIRTLKPSAIRTIPKGKLPSLVFGGPPCQGFSFSNLRTRTSENESNWLFTEFLRVVKVWGPEWVVFENVRGLANTEGGLFLEMVQCRLKKLEYETEKLILNAKDFGVPQDRDRLFIVGNRCGQKFRAPVGKRAAVTVRDAIGDLPKLENGAAESWRDYARPARSVYAKSLRGKRERSPNHLVTRNAKYVINRYCHIPQGGNWENIPANLMRNYRDRSRCHTGIYHRLRLDEPSIVIGNYRKNMLIHPIQHRGLSVREAARLQSFPDCFEFKGSIGFQQQQVGNAVPPLLAQAVFKAVVAASK